MKRLLIALILAAALTPSAAFALPSKVTRWTPVIRAAAAHEHLSAADTRWLLAKLPGVIYREHGGSESRGRGSCVGLLQYDAGWQHHGGWYPGHHHADWRLCGKCSIYRLAWGFKHSSGRGWVRAKWAATIR
jgi:hypothetical protein